MMADGGTVNSFMCYRSRSAGRASVTGDKGGIQPRIEKSGVGKRGWGWRGEGGGA